MTSFSETQRFTQPWIWAICVGSPILLLMAGLTAEPKVLFATPVVVLVMVMVLALRLEVSVEDEGLRMRFVPFVKRLIRWEEITSAKAVTYRPIREYGGWGLRRGWDGTPCYNVRGSEGVMVHLQNGKRLLIGSQRSKELAEAIEARLGKAFS